MHDASVSLVDTQYVVFQGLADLAVWILAALVVVRQQEPCGHTVCVRTLLYIAGIDVLIEGLHFCAIRADAAPTSVVLVAPRRMVK